MSYLTQLTDKKPDRAINSLVQATIRTAMQDWNLPFQGDWAESGIGIVNLRSRDISATNQSTGLQGDVLGSATWGVSSFASSTWSSWIDLSIDDRVYLVVTGLFNREGNPAITHIKVSANGKEMPPMCLEPFYTWDQAFAYINKPFAVTPGNKLKIEILPDKAIGVGTAGHPTAERIGLIGYAIGKRTYLIATS